MIARNADKPLAAPKKVFLDGETFLERSKFTKEQFVPAAIDKSLVELSFSYHLIFLFDEASWKARIKRWLGSEVDKPVPGQTLALPVKDWAEKINESESVFIYVNSPSTDEVGKVIPNDRMVSYTPNAKTMRRILDNELVRKQEKVTPNLKTELRSMYEKRKAPENRFARKFY